MKRIYLDNASTTQPEKEAIDSMLPYLRENYGNASSIHLLGREAKKVLEDCRKRIAKRLNANAHEIIFTSGGTESNNFALKGTAFANRKKGKHIITTKIEHSSILRTCKWLEEDGFEIEYLDVDGLGRIDPGNIKDAMREDTILISVIHGNNEIGTIQDIGKIGRIAREGGVYFHTDACQSYTKCPIDVKKHDLDLVSINAHKIGGPKGVGALYVRDGVKIDSLIHGGGHERGLRSGTENIPGIAGFAAASDIIKKEDIEKMTLLRNRLIERVLGEIPGSKLNGHPKERLCNNANFTFKGVDGGAMLLLLDKEGIMVSTGSACSSRSAKPSHVLLAIGLLPEEVHGSLRMSIGRQNTREEIDCAVEKLKKVIGMLRG